MPITQAEYVRRTRKLIRDVGRIGPKAQARARKLLRDVSRDINGIVAETSFSEFNQARLNRELEGVTNDFANSYNADLDELNQEIFGQVRDFHRTLEDASGRSLGAPVITLPQVEILQGMRAELIQKVGDDIRSRVSGEVARQVLAGGGVQDVVKAIRPFVAPIQRRDGSTVGSLSRANAIARTELGRAFSIINEQQLQNDADFLEQQGETVFKIWLHSGNINGRPTHVRAEVDFGIGGNPGPIPVKQDFIIGGEKVPFPRAPGISALNSVNCGCSHSLITPSIIKLQGEIRRAG